MSNMEPVLAMIRTICIVLCLCSCDKQSTSDSAKASASQTADEAYVASVQALRPLGDAISAFQMAAAEDFVSAMKKFSQGGFVELAQSLSREDAKLIGFSLKSSASLSFYGKDQQRPVVVFYNPLTDLVFSTQWDARTLKLIYLSFTLGSVGETPKTAMPLTDSDSTLNILRRAQYSTRSLASRLEDTYRGKPDITVVQGMDLGYLLDRLRVNVTVVFNGFSKVRDDEGIWKALTRWMDSPVADKFSAIQASKASALIKSLPFSAWNELQIGLAAPQPREGRVWALVYPRYQPWLWILLDASASEGIMPIDAACINL